jgi:excisionase family DNA binding protein
MPKQPLSIAEAAARTGIPKRTLQHAIATGRLKAHKFPGKTGAYLIDQRDLDRWATQREG